MIDATCPSCGRGGKLPVEKVNTRLVCRNCMQVFHVSKSNVAIKGDPPQVKGSSPDKKPKTKEAKPPKEQGDKQGMEMVGMSVPYKIAAGVLAVLVVSYFIWPFIFRGPETLEQRAIRAGEAILYKDDAKLRKLVTINTWENAKKWADETRPKLEAYAKRWPGHDLNVSALVISENRNTGRATAIAYYAPPQAAARTGSASGDVLTDSSGKAEPMGIPLVFVLDTSDRWFIEGRETAKPSQY